MITHVPLQEASPRDLPDRSDRALARLARKARSNVWLGGASALLCARRLEAMGSRLPALRCVRDAYASSTGEAREFLAYACPECGQARLGQTAALECCTEPEFTGFVEEF